MSAYRYAASNDNMLRIRNAADPAHVWVSVGTPDGDIRGLHIPNADVPAVALELLKAAGRTDLAGYIAAVVEREAMDAREAAKKAEAEAAEKKLQERREELAKKAGHPTYMYAPQNIKTLIAQVVVLQDKLDGASRD